MMVPAEEEPQHEEESGRLARNRAHSGQGKLLIGQRSKLNSGVYHQWPCRERSPVSAIGVRKTNSEITLDSVSQRSAEGEPDQVDVRMRSQMIGNLENTVLVKEPQVNTRINVFVFNCGK